MRKFNVGDESIAKTVMDSWKNGVFGDLSGDRNPVHFDEERMKKTRYGKPIANGIQTLSLVGTAIVDLFTTNDTMPIAIEQHNSFIKPVYINDTITAMVEIIDNPQGTPLKDNEYWVGCKVFNQDTECVLAASFRIRVLNA